MGKGAESTPAGHVQELLARAQNPFDICDSALTRLDSAVMYQVELQSWRHRSTPRPTLRCSSFRHVFLLSDGSSELLWELRYDDESGEGPPLHEVYDSERALRYAEQRVHRVMGDSPPHDGGPGDSAEDGPGDSATEGPDGGVPALGFEAFGAPVHFEAGEAAGTAAGSEETDGPAAVDDDGLLHEYGEFDQYGERHDYRGFGEAHRAPFGPYTGFLLPDESAGIPAQREYAEGDSHDHARRLLRRAENPDRPGDDVLRLLATARGHEILHVPKPHVLAKEWHVWCSVYEHAFLLADGSAISLYELEHNLSGTGRLVCEVYLDEAFADQAAHRRARDHGIDL